MRIPDGDLVPARRRRYRGGYGRRRFVRRRRAVWLVAVVVVAGAGWLLTRPGRPLALAACGVSPGPCVAILSK